MMLLVAVLLLRGAAALQATRPGLPSARHPRTALRGCACEALSCARGAVSAASRQAAAFVSTKPGIFVADVAISRIALVAAPAAILLALAALNVRERRSLTNARLAQLALGLAPLAAAEIALRGRSGAGALALQAFARCLALCAASQAVATKWARVESGRALAAALSLWRLAVLPSLLLGAALRALAAAEPQLAGLLMPADAYAGRVTALVARLPANELAAALIAAYLVATALKLARLGRAAVAARAAERVVAKAAIARDRVPARLLQAVPIRERPVPLSPPAPEAIMPATAPVDAVADALNDSAVFLGGVKLSRPFGEVEAGSAVRVSASRREAADYLDGVLSQMPDSVLALLPDNVLTQLPELMPELAQMPAQE
ncbi:hypothetical protein M885DRAFT_514403 [Pelagophyceae sp. CCMP2097]|nr:hypothetical protein M885DRAFT_514403 [Pelagophyceae sp. CCMP2097]